MIVISVASIVYSAYKFNTYYHYILIISVFLKNVFYTFIFNKFVVNAVYMLIYPKNNNNTKKKKKKQYD